MYKNFSFKHFLSFLFIFFTYLFKNTSKAAGTDYMGTINSGISDTGKLIKNINTNIGGNLVLLMSSVAFILFLYGLVRFIYDRSNGNDKELDRDKKAMSWGLVALFVLVSVWGIIKMFQGFLGIQNTGDINLPKICPNGTCEKSSGSVDSEGGIKTKDVGDFDKSKDKLDKTETVVDGTYDIESIRAWSLNLKEGDGSPDGTNEIAQLQLFLKKHGCSNYLGNTGPNKDGIDGIFGPKTTTAVKAFQKANALKQDGVVGMGTKAVILYRYMNAKPERDNYYVDLWPNIMTSGQSTDANTDGAVSKLQTFLTDQEYNIGKEKPYKGIDGIYGGKTSDAVVAFQAKYYLKEDNLVGPSTKAVIMYVENHNN